MGAHHMVVDVGPDSFLIDCGVLFPAPWDVGVDHLAPPFSAALDRWTRGRLRGLLLTHGHRDHIGAVGHLLKAAPGLPVYARPFTLALLRRVLGKAGSKLNAIAVEASVPTRIGEVDATWFPVTHSLPEACSLALESPLGVVVHSGDFRIQPDPFLGPPTDVSGLKALGERGVDLALVDSTGAARPGRTLPERDVADNLVDAVGDVDGLVLITTFSSHVERVAACIRVAELTGRTPALYGRSLESTVSTARDLGLFEEWGSRLRSIDQVATMGSKGLVIVTGTQGEARAPLSRIARGEDPRIKLGPGDAVLWSARAIPGNDRSIGLVVNRLVDLGVTVVPPWGDACRGLHTSGHGLRDEVSEWLSWVRPRAVLPIHGEAWHLHAHRHALLDAGHPDAQVLSLRSGGAVRLEDGTCTATPERPTVGMSVGVGRELWPHDEPALRERRRIARTGVVAAKIHGRTISVVSVGVFPAAERDAIDAALEVAATQELERPDPGSEDLVTRIRLTLRRAVKARTGDRVECIVRNSVPLNGK